MGDDGTSIFKRFPTPDLNEGPSLWDQDEDHVKKHVRIVPNDLLSLVIEMITGSEAP